MTEIERRLVLTLWNVLYGTFEKLADPKDEDTYRFIHRTYWEKGDLKPEVRAKLVAIAWEHRDLLPPDLVLAVALKGGGALSAHMLSACHGDTITDPEGAGPA